MNRSYVLITPARNEASFLEETIRSVISQTIPPSQWIIANDNSTDDTEKIVLRYSREYHFIKLVRVRNSETRNFSAKVYAFNTGLEALDELRYAYIGNLDADVTFAPDYFDRILHEFEADPHLGLAGGVILESIKGVYQPRYTMNQNVAGAVQLFRRECFESIGGYIPMRFGGVDSVAQYMACMKGWRAETFPTIPVFHLRPTGTAGRSRLSARFRAGREDYSYGSHPVFEFAKFIYRLPEHPVFAGSFMRLSGYVMEFLKREPRTLPDPVIRYIRQTQMEKLVSFSKPLSRIFGPPRKSGTTG